MSLFDKFQGVADVQAQFEALGIRPLGAITEELFSATEGVVNGKRVLLAGTNNYLGLTFEPDCIESACAALRRQGTGTTGSRMANGTFADHVQLERELADFFQRKDCIVFSTGYAATMGLSATLAGPGDVILLDADSHASIYDGVRLSGAEIIRFRHNDPENLNKRLARLGDRLSNTLVIVEGIYSMLGDQAPLTEIAELKKRYGFTLMVDEAHSLGVLGKHGRGAAEAQQCEAEVDFVVGTFSKSLGAIGGYCASNHPMLNAIRFSIRSYIFTASLSPSVVASTRCALRILRSKRELRDALWRNAAQLYQGLKELGFEVGPEVSPVVAVTIKNSAIAMRSWQQLLEAGVFVNLVVPPAAPSTDSLLRCSISAAFTPAQISRILDAFAGLSDARARAG